MLFKTLPHEISLSPFKNYKLSASFQSVPMFPISPSFTSTEVVEDECFDHSLSWFDQPTAFWRANTQEVQPMPCPWAHTPTAHFSFPRLQLPFLLWRTQRSRPVTSTYYFRGCSGKNGCGNFCFHQGRRGKGCYLLLRWEVGLKQSASRRKNYSSMMPFQGEGVQLKLKLGQTAYQMLMKKQISLPLRNKDKRRDSSL